VEIRFAVIGVDEGLVATGDFSGSLVTLTIDPLTGEQTQLPAIAPTGVAPGERRARSSATAAD
jgi:hypothetical protein